MAFCTPAELVDAASRDRTIYSYTRQRSSYTPSRMHYTAAPFAGRLNLEQAKKIIEDAKLATKNHNQQKVNRPYELVPITDRLNQDETWIGWEIECGWADQPNYDRVIDYIWRYQNHVTVDIEGAGLPTEITFPPEEASKVFAGKAQVHRFLNWVQRSGVRSARWDEHSCVGTHCNISTPKYRDSQRDRYPIVAQINRVLESLNEAQKRQLFGRGRPYGYGYSNGSGRSAWIEFKLFNSTIDPNRFATYVDTSKGLAALIDAAVDGEIVTLDRNQSAAAGAACLRVERQGTYAPYGNTYLNAFEFLTTTSGERPVIIAGPAINYTVEEKAAMQDEARAIINALRARAADRIAWHRVA